MTRFEHNAFKDVSWRLFTKQSKKHPKITHLLTHINRSACWTHPVGHAMPHVYQMQLLPPVSPPQWLRGRTLFSGYKCPVFESIQVTRVSGGSKISHGGGGVDLLGGCECPTWVLFSENVCKNERIASCRGGHVPDKSLDLPMGVVTKKTFFFLKLT